MYSLKVITAVLLAGAASTPMLAQALPPAVVGWPGPVHYNPADSNTIGKSSAISNINSTRQASGRPTVHESAIQARKILSLEKYGVLATIFQDDAKPPSPPGTPIALPEYFADCEHNGNPTFAAISVDPPFINAAAGSNVSLCVEWHPDPSSPLAASPAALPRFSLTGYIEALSAEEIAQQDVAKCFLAAHPDSKPWVPGPGSVHMSQWARLVVTDVYWFGGFGNVALIQWLPIEEWRNVTQEEMDAMALPGLDASED
ncbi:MAG: hypothetical protein M1838_000663 [Thelocarpon superellum]|nr:MAG: hypothetical protein M1838_000663 [Thelocarpon superellum]